MARNDRGADEFDVLVMGSGAGGLTAAIVAADLGMRVLLVEKTSLLGGTTAISGGGLWIPDNPHMAGLGLTDTREEARQYLRAITGNLYAARKIDAFLENGPDMVRFLEANTEVRFLGGLSSDYEPAQPGAKSGRTLLTPSYDAKKLGDDFAHLRPALDQFGAFGGMQIGFQDAAHFLSVLHSPRSFLYSAGKFARYLWDRLCHGRATRLVNGNALVARLLHSARRRDITIWRNAPMVELIADAGTVTGAVVQRAGTNVRVRTTHGVILASGGYGANQTMRRANMPMADAGWSLQPEGNQGDGIALGQAAGGVFVRENIDNGIWAPMSSMTTKEGRQIHFSHIMLDRHRPGLIVVDQRGRRFVNEGCSYQAFCKAMHTQGIDSAWLIGSHAAIRRHSMGLAKPAPLPLRPYLANGYLKKARTIRELAGVIGVDPHRLTDTVDTFNRYAATGKDPDFHRGNDPYSARQGDASHMPNPSLGELRRGPFYAVQLRPGELSTLNGLDTNEHAQVIRPDGAAIAGLYAVGVDANSPFRGAYPGGGASLGPTMTFAFIAAHHIAKTGARDSQASRPPGEDRS